jgi:hypothetical protein
VRRPFFGIYHREMNFQIIVLSQCEKVPIFRNVKCCTFGLLDIIICFVSGICALFLGLFYFYLFFFASGEITP